jgi:hypothetical protein
MPDRAQADVEEFRRLLSREARECASIAELLRSDAMASWLLAFVPCPRT